MINVKIKGESYSIVSNIYECDIHKLVKAENEREELVAISDIPRAVVAFLDIETFLPLIEFLNSDYDYTSTDIKCADVSNESYEKLELAKIAIQNNDKIYRQVYEVAKIYHPDRKKSTTVFKTGINLINQINLFLDEYSEMYEEGPSMEEQQAGIEELSKMGAWGTLYALSGKDVTKIGQLAQMPAIEIYNALLQNYRESKYMDALYKIKNPK